LFKLAICNFSGWSTGVEPVFSRSQRDALPARHRKHELAQALRAGH